MREIRFRAWDEELQVMSNPFTLGDLQNHEDFTFNTPDGEACCGYNEFGLDNPKHILEQYTGLKDKNGVEIYESDKITNGDKNIKFSTKYVVEWIDCGFRARQIGTKSSIGLEYWKDSIEVIGNIHQEVKI